MVAAWGRMSDTTSNTASPAYQVFVDDNFHFMDENERFLHGNYATFEEAEAACKRIVDQSLADVCNPGMTADALYTSYSMFGDDPFIRGPKACITVLDFSTGAVTLKPRFSAWEYARQRATEMCGNEPQPSVDAPKGDA